MTFLKNILLKGLKGDYGNKDLLYLCIVVETNGNSKPCFLTNKTLTIMALEYVVTKECLALTRQKRKSM